MAYGFSHFLISMEIFLVYFWNSSHNYNRYPVAACAHVGANEKQMGLSFPQVCQVYEILYFGLSVLKTVPAWKLYQTMSR